MKKVLFKALFLLCAFSMPGIINAQKSTTTTQQSGEVVITQPEFKGGMEGLYKYILEQFETKNRPFFFLLILHRLVILFP